MPVVYRIVAGKLFLLAALLLHGTVWGEEDALPRDYLTVWSGMLPIILAAPHGGRLALAGVPSRRGVGVAQFSAARDYNTAELAETVAVKIDQKLGAKPFLVVAHFERKFVDANRPEPDAFESATAKPFYEAYHEAIIAAVKRIRERWGQGLLIDIHGQATEADAIFRGTDNGKSVTALQQRYGRAALTGPKSILGQLAATGYQVFPDSAGDQRERRYTGGYTTRSYGSHRGTQVDAIQLEFGPSLRTRRNLERTAADLADAILVFAKEYLPATEAVLNR